MEKKVIRKFFKGSSRYLDLYRLTISIGLLFMYFIFTILFLASH